VQRLLHRNTCNAALQRDVHPSANFTKCRTLSEFRIKNSERVVAATACPYLTIWPWWLFYPLRKIKQCL